MDGLGSCNQPNWKGGEIYIKVNENKIETIPSQYEGDFKYCWPKNEVNVEQDIFTFEASNNDGVCISGLQINGEQLNVGKNDDQSEFWIDKDNNRCDDNYMSTAQISIQNGEIISSACKGEI